jgi:ATP-binding cassette subfamily C (CFTR/MRP) protein 1
MLLPTALSALTDAYNATKRLTDLFEAETHDTALSIDPSQASAILVSSASFEWVGPPSEDSPSFKKASSAESKAKSAAAFAEKEKEADAAAEPFKIENLQMEIKKGSLVAVVGTVGSGKSSLLQGLIGEMKLVEGKVSFSGRVAYWCVKLFFFWSRTAKPADQLTSP